MAKAFEMELITPVQVLYTGSATQLSVPGVAGSLGILANHAPLMTELKIGEIRLTEESGENRVFYVGGGFLEVNNNHVTLLSEEAADKKDISVEEAERIHKAMLSELELATDDDDINHLKLMVERSAAKLKVAKG